MLYKFNTYLSEQDYLEFNTFWMFKSHYGKKQFMSMRIIIAVILLFIALISLFGGGFTLSSFLGIIPILILFALFEIFLKPFFKLTIKWQLQAMKKRGKLPYSPSAVMEFYDNSFTETTDENKTEVKYSAIERISIINGKFIYIHINNIMAYMIPIYAFESNEQYTGFIDFLKTINNNIDFY